MNHIICEYDPSFYYIFFELLDIGYIAIK